MTPEKISRWIVYGCAIYILGAIVYLRPHFGLMDDATNLFLLQPKIAESGLLQGMWNYFKDDIGWGMLRFLYPVETYFLYSIGIAYGSVALYLVNAVLIIVLFYFHARLMEKILKINRWFILLCSCAFFYGYDLFQHPSLQEKTVLFFGMFLLSLSAQENITPWKKIIGCALLSILGIGGKTSFFIYICSSYVFILPTKQTYRERSKWVVCGYLTIFYILLFLVCSYVSSRGIYTSTFHNPENIIRNIQSKDFLMLITPVIMAILLFGKKSFSEMNFKVFFPTISILVFLAIFLAWGITGYIQSIIAPLYSALIIQIVVTLLPNRKWFWIIPLSILTITVCAYRGYSMFYRLHDIRLIVNKAKELSDEGITDIYLPCNEAWHTMRDYFKYYSGVEMKFHYLPYDQINAKNLHDKIIMFDSGLCPLPGKAEQVPGCTTTKLYFQSEFSRSFRIARLYCSQ